MNNTSFYILEFKVNNLHVLKTYRYSVVRFFNGASCMINNSVV
jgi:hypothetical protein